MTHPTTKVSEEVNNICPVVTQFYNFQHPTPILSPKIMSHFVDHITIFMLLRTWENMVIEVIVNKCVVCSTIGYLNWAS